jgi:hypothetical protein
MKINSSKEKKLLRYWENELKGKGRNGRDERGRGKETDRKKERKKE